MNSCEGCYYEDRSPMEMCNCCTKDADGVLTGWRGKGDPAIVSPSQSASLTATPSRAQAPDAQEGQDDDWMASDPERDKDLLIDHLKNRIHVLEKERDDCADGYEYLQCKIDDLQEQMGKLEAENEYLRKTLDWNKREQEVLSGKLEMVYLIFGGGGDG